MANVAAGTVAMSRVLYEQDVARRILALREDLVRHDENAAALALMEHVVPYFLQAHPDILAARERQRQMCLHLIDPDAYAEYYATNIHERPFEQQYPGATVDNAHLLFHRVGFLRGALLRQRIHTPIDDEVDLERGSKLRVLDASCNDGWMAANLALHGYRCDGIDLNPDCIQRAKARKGRSDLGLMGEFHVGACEDAPAFAHGTLYDAVVCFETIEHVAGPDHALYVLRQVTAPGGRLYVSTPNGTDHNGDLATWDHVEPKGHVRVYTPESFHQLLSAYGTVERMEQGPDRVMVAEVSL